jgi:hypothetical protein
LAKKVLKPRRENVRPARKASMCQSAIVIRRSRCRAMYVAAPNKARNTREMSDSIVIEG